MLMFKEEKTKQKTIIPQLAFILFILSRSVNLVSITHSLRSIFIRLLTVPPPPPSRHIPKIIPTYTIRSAVGFRPYTPHIWQGMRMLPPISVPIPMTDPPPPISAPSPPEDPPGARFKLWGLRVWPYIGLEQANLLEGKQKSWLLYWTV